MVQAVIIFSMVFIVGAALLLEQRCLGKPAVVQPLLLCLISGLVFGELETGLWLGISFQLLSMGQNHYCNWVLSSIAGAGTIAILGAYDVHPAPGSPSALTVLLTGIIAGIVFDFLDRKINLNRTEEVEKKLDLWKSQNGDEFAGLIYRKVIRGFVFGGVQSILGVGMAALPGYLMTVYYPEPSDLIVQRIVSLAVPLFGVAVTLGSLSGRHFPFYALIGVAVSAGIGGLM